MDCARLTGAFEMGAPLLFLAHENVWTLPRPWKSMRNCAIIHPLHLELETAV